MNVCACLCPTQALTEAVIARLRSCVDEDVFIPLYPKKSGFFFVRANILFTDLKDGIIALYKNKTVE